MPAGDEHGERQEDRGVDQHETAAHAAAARGPRCAPDVHEDERRRARAGQSFAAIAAPSASAAEHEPFVQKRGEREHDERGRPEVEARQHDRSHAAAARSRRARAQPSARGPATERCAAQGATPTIIEAAAERHQPVEPAVVRVAVALVAERRQARTPAARRAGTRAGSRGTEPARRHRVAVGLVQPGVGDLPARERSRGGAATTRRGTGRAPAATSAAQATAHSTSNSSAMSGLACRSARWSSVEVGQLVTERDQPEPLLHLVRDPATRRRAAPAGARAPRRASSSSRARPQMMMRATVTSGRRRRSSRGSAR